MVGKGTEIFEVNVYDIKVIKKTIKENKMAEQNSHITDNIQEECHHHNLYPYIWQQ